MNGHYLIPIEIVCHLILINQYQSVYKVIIWTSNWLQILFRTNLYNKPRIVACIVYLLVYIAIMTTLGIGFKSNWDQTTSNCLHLKTSFPCVSSVYLSIYSHYDDTGYGIQCTCTFILGQASRKKSEIDTRFSTG